MIKETTSKLPTFRGIACCVLTLVAGLVPAAPAAPLVGSDAPIPFIQRISTSDFLAVESRLGHALSKSCTLIIYRPEGDHGWSAVGIAATAKGTRELIGLKGETTGEESEPRISQTRVAIQPEIAAQIEQSFRSIMERNVYTAGGRIWKTSPEDRDRWILLRVNPTQAIAGLALTNALHGNRSDFAVVFSDMLRGMHDVIGAADDERGAALLELDKLTARFVLMEKAGLKP